MNLLKLQLKMWVVNLDPTCGSGRMLIESRKYVESSVGNPNHTQYDGDVWIVVYYLELLQSLVLRHKFP